MKITTEELLKEMGQGKARQHRNDVETALSKPMKHQ
jgi:hypothetical protein